MTKAELHTYCKWYIEQIPWRIAILEKAVKSTPGYTDWEINYLPESLDRLGAWFEDQVAMRERTDEEMWESYERLAGPFKDINFVSDRELTEKTYSLAIDIGMHVSQIFLNIFPSLEWQYILKGRKDNIHYGQPVLSGFGKLEFNPVHMMLVLAWGLIDGTRTKTDLRELFDIWKDMIS